MSSLLDSTAIALLVLLLTLPTLAGSNDAVEVERFAGGGVASDAAPAACPAFADCPMPAAIAALRVASDHRSGSDRPLATTHPLDLALDGESDDRESTDPFVVTGRIAPSRRSLQRAWAVASAQHGFAEGLYGARAPRAPPLR